MTENPSINTRKRQTDGAAAVVRPPWRSFILLSTQLHRRDRSSGLAPGFLKIKRIPVPGRCSPSPGRQTLISLRRIRPQQTAERRDDPDILSMDKRREDPLNGHVCVIQQAHFGSIIASLVNLMECVSSRQSMRTCLSFKWSPRFIDLIVLRRAQLFPKLIATFTQKMTMDVFL